MFTFLMTHGKMNSWLKKKYVLYIILHFPKCWVPLDILLRIIYTENETQHFDACAYWKKDYEFIWLLSTNYELNSCLFSNSQLNEFANSNMFIDLLLFLGLFTRNWVIRFTRWWYISFGNFLDILLTSKYHFFCFLS